MQTSSGTRNPHSTTINSGFAKFYQTGQRIYEKQNYITQNENKFQNSSKIFTSLKPKQVFRDDKTSRRTQSTLSGKQEIVKHKREFSMPDYINVDYPD